MREFFRKYGFAATAVTAVAALFALVGLKELADGFGKGEAAGGASRQGGPPGAPGGGGQGRGGGRGGGLTVVAEAVAKRPFSDEIQAIGTAQARESVVISSKVTEVIRAIRFESGDKVAKGQVLVELSSVEQLADLKEAEANLAVQQREYDRFRELGERGFAPTARVEEARAAFERASARVDALKARINERLIRAPFAGVMGLRTASAGLLATPGTQLGTLDDVSQIKLDFDVPETELGRLKLGSEIVAESAAYPGAPFLGKIDDIDSRVDPRVRTVRVRALLDNKDGRMKPGMLLTVKIRAGGREALTAPEMALVEEGSQAFVFRVAEAEGVTSVERVAVLLGQRGAGMVEILDGLNPGDRVVTEGVQRVRPGMPVSVRAADEPGAAAGAAKPARS